MNLNLPTDPLLGRQLSNFRLERILGRGGMAQVYYGMDVKLRRPVAVKVIDARHRSKPKYAERFLKEARAVARLRHENIIQIYYADDENGLYYYVMEYVDGQDLGSLLSERSAHRDLLPYPEVLRIGRALASALDFAHSRGIIHRDVKPSNVMLSSDGRVILGDFGLALDLSEGSSGEAFGSPHYISPEQARRSSDAVPQSDLYSLGVILYEMLTGVVPFDDESFASVALKHLQEPPPPARQQNPALNAQTEEVLFRALAKSPAERYPSGAALMDALSQALPAAPTPASLPLPPPPAAILSGKTRAAAQRPASLPTPPRRKNGWLWLPLSLTLLVAAWFFGKNLLPGGFNPLAALPFLAPSPTLTEIVPAAAASPLPGKTPTLALSPSASPSPSVSPSPRPSQTSSATASLTPSATFTASPPPSATFTASPPSSATLENTATQSPTLTEALTSAETPTLTDFPLTPSDFPTFTTTPQFVNYKRLWLYYDSFGLYLYNASDSNRSLSAFGFQRLLSAGGEANAFSGNEWASRYAILHPNRCVGVQVQGNPNPYLNPPVCRNMYLVLRNLPPGDERIFWTPQEGSTQFSLSWLGQEMGKCDISAGFCEIFIP